MGVGRRGENLAKWFWHAAILRGPIPGCDINDGLHGVLDKYLATVTRTAFRHDRR